MEIEADSTTDENGASNKFECAVCLQLCVQPVQLPCRHVFCYLCVKGVTHQSKRCAMCRQEIPANYLDNPHLIAAHQPSIAFEGSYQWFYEGRNGWWQYDDRTSSEIEAAYKKGEPQCEVLIAGFLYVIDFQKNIQVRRCDPHRKRNIKRDLITIQKKGVAGIRCQPDIALSDAVQVNENGVNTDALRSLSDEDTCQNDTNDTPHDNES
ncbi:e3 ubiquitin-protein ligase RNF146-B [Caerostris extrusa]|uniref:E3 ubiquitin-protein ligase n=1 Tax=Caerostris extrusa TaxID=172846 RepID=A0AAV4Q9N2_CAEEX|nr:e3 ubiquitin-protein ligase RNF146-B [Caerostris extrusa]